MVKEEGRKGGFLEEESAESSETRALKAKAKQTKKRIKIQLYSCQSSGRIFPLYIGPDHGKPHLTKEWGYRVTQRSQNWS